MQVNRPVADGAAAGQAYRRLAHARHKRAQHKDGRAHLAHNVIGGDGVVDRLAVKRQAAARQHAALAALDGDSDAEMVEEVSECGDIRQPRQVLKRDLVFRQ